MVKRFPAQIGSFEIKNGSYAVDGLIEKLKCTISDTHLISKEKFGILLSGGIDSAVLALLNRQFEVPCFTVGRSIYSPDVMAAMQFATEKDIKLYVHIPNNNEVKIAKSLIKTKYPGDEGVYIALNFVSKFASCLIATEGIDELMGGYWWHTNRTEEYPNIEKAFEYFWKQLEPAHLTPMFKAAKQTGINIYWVFLQPYIVEYISRIPLKDRVENGVNKAIWKRVAKKIGVPQWVIDRPKRGFIDALS